MNLAVFCSCEPASLKYIHLVFDALKSKLCDAAKYAKNSQKYVSQYVSEIASFSQHLSEAM